MTYEQPLNEQVRLCLRLEYLFEQSDQYMLRNSPLDSHQIIKIIIEVLQATDRSDLKNKFCQTLSQYTQVLTQLEKHKEIDKEKLDDTLKQIDYLLDALRVNTQKIGQALRENEFLAAIQQRLYTPAGTCSFSLPSYYLWLQQPSNLRHNQLSNWLGSFAQPRNTIALILKLIRESAPFKEVKANAGFYQCGLDTAVPYQMIRVKLHTSQNLFPEISVGRHRLAIHFFTLDILGKTAQTTTDVPFELACCRM